MLADGAPDQLRVALGYIGFVSYAQHRLAVYIYHRSICIAHPKGIQNMPLMWLPLPLSSIFVCLVPVRVCVHQREFVCVCRFREVPRLRL